MWVLIDLRKLIPETVSTMATVPRAALMVQGGPAEGRMVPLSDGTTTIGRTSLTDIVVDEAGVSRQHAVIRGDSEGFWISDLGSRNGTFVNEARVGQEPQRLRNWDRIELGGMTTHWVFMESQETVEVPQTLVGADSTVRCTMD